MLQTMPIRKPHKNARKLRKDMPSAEQRLWYFIRRKQLGGFRFRRQHTIAPYIADFVCVEAKLVIELDGEQHGLDGAPEHDEKRNAFMESEGWAVVRFWNNDVYDNIDGVLEMILDAAGNSVRALEIEKSRKDKTQ
jgi:very-short-patch-repair endonuclease